jgi:hypothetical protein
LKKEKNIIKIEWHVRKLDTAKEIEGPVDFTIYINDIKTFYIEVKSTIDKTNETFSLSKDEWAFMKKHRDECIFARVYDVNGTTPRISFFKDPFRMICTGLIVLDYLGSFKLEITEENRNSFIMFNFKEEINRRLSLNFKDVFKDLNFGSV